MTIDKNNSHIKVDQLIEGFRVNQIENLPLLNNIMYRLEHEKTGAVMIHLSNDDDNNCFSVAFRTTPQDSTGVAHILEHTALCGSEDFPVRDPFFSMIRRSMKTFMNAFTASDWTMYPFSTQIEKDYFNLMSVYLDAAFFPSLSEESFMQEGHRLEFSDPDASESPLSIQGVVYNEMKGAMSSQSSIMHDCTGRALFPTITYKHNSGGDPQEIIKLTHEQLTHFHRFHYHPSNAYFYSYGDIPVEKTLKTINRNVLARFSRIEIETAVPDEVRYETPREFSFQYPLNEQDDDGERCQVALAWLTCKIDQPLEVLSLQILSLILLGHSGAPLRKKLIESGLGKALADTTGFEDEIKEPYFSVGLQAVAEHNIEKIEALILTTLEEIYKQGIQKEQIESAIHQIELDTREISGGHYPYSLNLLFRFFGTWVHGGDPATAIDFDSTLEDLKSKLDKEPFLEKQLKKYLIDNPHRVKIVLRPDKDLENSRNQKLEIDLEQVNSKMSSEDKQRLIDNAQKLKTLQGKKEDLSCLPSLKIDDIPKEIKFVDPVVSGINDLDVTFFERPTNGIAYINWYFEMTDFPEKERIWLPLLSYLLTNTGAGEFSYEEMAEKLSLYTGGFSASPSFENSTVNKEKYSEYFVISSKALNRNLGKLFDFASLITGPRKFNETDRIQNLIGQRTNGMLNSIVQSGHNYAATLSSRKFGKGPYLDELYNGIHQIKFMKNLVGLSNDELDKISAHLQSLLKLIIRKKQLSTLVIGDDAALKDSKNYLAHFADQLEDKSGPFNPGNLSPLSENIYTSLEMASSPEAWTTTTPVSYVAQTFKTIPYNHKDSSKILVLANLLKSCFLHGEIREKGGAYGAMTGYQADEGLLSLISYRDPNLSRTLESYKEAFTWLQKGDFSEQDVNETILQTCSSMDTPVSPAGKALVEFLMKRRGKTKTMRKAFREGVLSCSKKDLIRVGEEYIEQESSIAAVTSDSIVEKDKQSAGEDSLSRYII
jgi:presequence protease